MLQSFTPRDNLLNRPTAVPVTEPQTWRKWLNSSISCLALSVYAHCCPGSDVFLQAAPGGINFGNNLQHVTVVFFFVRSDKRQNSSLCFSTAIRSIFVTNDKKKKELVAEILKCANKIKASHFALKRGTSCVKTTVNNFIQALGHGSLSRSNFIF